MNSLVVVLSRVAAVLMIATAVGCASQQDGPSQTTKSIESLSGMRSSVATAHAQVDRLIATMNAVSSGNDLENAYKSFNAEVAELRASATRAATRAKSLKEKDKEYIAAWQDEMGSANTETEKAALEQRKVTVRRNYESARIAAQSVRQVYGPLNTKLTDIQQSLASNLTPARAAEIRPVIDQARREAQELKNRLANFAASLNQMQTGLSQSGTTAR